MGTGFMKSIHDICENDLAGLPKELLNELSIKKNKKDRINFDSRILYIIKKCGEISVDNILIQLYREYGKVYKRKYLIHKLYKMKISGLLSKKHVKGNMIYYVNPQHTT